MLTFERTEDLGLVRAILTIPECYRRMKNDAAPERRRFKVKRSEGIEFVLARNDGQVAALFLLDRNEVHYCFLPKFWGRTRKIARAFLKWVWITTGRTRLTGSVPAYNRLALRLAVDVGFSQFGVERNAVEKHGKPFDLILLEVLRPC